MKIKLDLVKTNKDPITDRELVYDGAIPLPLTGEDIIANSARWTVNKREFMVSNDGTFKVVLWCDGPKELLDDKY